MFQDGEVMLQGEPEQRVRPDLLRVSPGNPGTPARALSYPPRDTRCLRGQRGPAPGGARRSSPLRRLPTVAVRFKMVSKATSHGRVLRGVLKRSPYLSAPTFLQTRPARKRGRGRAGGRPLRAVTRARRPRGARGCGRQVPSSRSAARLWPRGPARFPMPAGFLQSRRKLAHKTCF